MSYEDTNCPCGDAKERETMLCKHCEEYFAQTTELATLKTLHWPIEAKRVAAVRLLSMARRRKTTNPPHGRSAKP